MGMTDPIAQLRAAGWGPARLSSRMDDITPQAISQWRQVPADRVIEIERITGISRHELRPDLSRIFVERSPSEKEDAA
jgi:DNA-binding transcriptional regulator YdaS (Cro superfamily)